MSAVFGFCASIYMVSFVYGSSQEIYAPIEPTAVPEDFDCPMRQLALEFAMSIQPFLATDKLQQIADALNGAKESVNRSCVTVPSDWKLKKTLPPSWDDLNIIDDTPSIYVDFIKGNDNNDGTINSPLKYLDSAIEYANKWYGPNTYKRIILRAGRHYLRKTINITPNDNNLLITNYNHELVELSGASPINCQWQPVSGQQWKILNNTDGIWGGPPGPGLNSSDGSLIFLGDFNTFEDCQNAVTAVYKEYGFGAFTWEDSTGKSVCYGIVGSNYKNNQQSNSITGVLQNVYKCQITDNTITDIKGLRINGTRAIRARYPNGNPEVYPCGFCSSLKAKSWVQPTCKIKPTMEYHPDQPLRATSIGNYFQKYQMGIGGCCDGFTPNGGYWCGNHTQGGGAFTYRIPAGLHYDKSVLPNSPYVNLDGAVIQAWRPGHWASWMFGIDISKTTSNTIMFSKGGFQGARGDNNGDEFFIENVMEEVDYPTEWFYNISTKTLYYYNNGSGSPDTDNIVFETTNLKILLNYTGTMDKPVENQEIRGMTMRDSQITYLDPHGMPSGGDWGLERTGAIYLDGVKNITISTNILTRLDGNAISVNRYARDVTIYRNEIVWQGDNAVSMWGDTQNISMNDGSTMGWDGTDGNQPRGTQFIQNFVHEIGIWEKQSSMWFQAKSCSNMLDSNIFFNGPRAGINFNDGFGGNSTLKKNLLFNTCRESGDHGPFNSWDRQVYVTKVNNGTASVIKAYDHIYNNFMIADYSAGFAIDNDDGSCYYDTHDNFFVYGNTGMKNDFGGHDNHHYNNIYGYIGSHCFGVNGQLKGHQDEFHNNTCIINNGGQTTYGSFDCSAQNSGNQWPKMGQNTIYMSAGGDPSKVGLCGMTESAFQSKNPGIDDGTVVKGKPNDQQIIALAKATIM